MLVKFTGLLRLGLDAFVDAREGTCAIVLVTALPAFHIYVLHRTAIIWTNGL